MPTKFVFNSSDLGHRKLLALAIEDFIDEPGNTVSGSSDENGKALLEELKKQGTPYTKGKIDRLKKARLASKLEGSYPRDPLPVVKYLSRTGYFPPGRNTENTLKLLPVFFGGISDPATQLLREISGAYTCYQFSNLDPRFIVTSEFQIEKICEWRYAYVREEMLIEHNGRSKLIYEGVAFSDSKRNLYILMREKTSKHPRFYLFDDSDRPEPNTVETIFGTVLAAARLYNSHLSPVCLYRGNVPAPPKPVSTEDLSSLPRYVAGYLAKPLAPGYSNATE